MMKELDVRIVELKPVRVASSYAFGPSPEVKAWETLIDWANGQGLLAAKPRIFGFNNPDPSPGSPNYGYEFWLVVRGKVADNDEIEIKSFAGGRYAVTRCRGADRLGSTWQALAAWVEDSPHETGAHQWLEEHLGPTDRTIRPGKMIFDLFYPIS